MVVVVIIAISAAIAIPLAVRQLRDQTTQRLAQSVSALYRNSRMLAMSRGSAVLVSYNNGVIAVREATQGTTTGPNQPPCLMLPVVQCERGANAWLAANELGGTGTGTNRLIEVIDQANFRTSSAGRTIRARLGATTQAQLDLCFSPHGRSFIRTNGTSLLNTPFVTVAHLDVFQYLGTATDTPFGMLRTVTVLPNGQTHLAARTP